MASGMYYSGLTAMMTGDVDLINDPITVFLIDTSLYTPNLVNDSDLSDVPEAALIKESLLTGKSVVDKVFAADDVVITTVEDTQPEIGGFLIIKDTGVFNTSTLLCWIDDAPELPATPDGGSFTINWNASGIFSL